MAYIWIIYLFFVFVFICALVFWSLMPCVFFKWVEHDSCCVCFFVYYLFSLSLVPLTRSYWCIEIVVSVMYVLWISLEKGECFNLNHSLGCLPYCINIIRPLGRVYHFSWLICYPCSCSSCNFLPVFRKFWIIRPGNWCFNFLRKLVILVEYGILYDFVNSLYFVPRLLMSRESSEESYIILDICFHA